ncbi:MAG: hypothetical protein AB1611_13505 [bacterium]
MKDFVGRRESIFIPEVVQREVVDAGKEKECPDAFIVEKNITADMITVVEKFLKIHKGRRCSYCPFSERESTMRSPTDDAKLIRLLRINSVPYVLPGLIIYHLLRDEIIEKKIALWALEQ